MFNSQKIAELEADLTAMRKRIDKLESKLFGRSGCFNLIDGYQEKIQGRIPALEEFLGIEWKEGTPGYKKKKEEPFYYTGDPLNNIAFCYTSSNCSDSNSKPKKCPKK